jgi:hypothetical protein
MTLDAASALPIRPFTQQAAASAMRLPTHWSHSSAARCPSDWGRGMALRLGETVALLERAGLEVRDVDGRMGVDQILMVGPMAEGFSMMPLVRGRLKGGWQ